MSGSTQLTREQRYQIHALVKTGQNQTQMATVVGVHKATISRELRRNRGLCGYRPHQAHRLAQARQGPKRRARLAPTTWQQVETLVREAWSPEQIHGRLQREHGQTISHEWMYQYIYQDQQAGGDLYRSLRCQKTRRKRYGRYSRRGRIPNQVSIDERPAVVNTRQRLGDGEGDTIIGKGHRGVLVTLVERQSKYTVLEGVQHKTAAAVRKAVARGLRPHQLRVQTITYDNGREFSDHAGMAKDLDARISFALPYASWERGVNENTNGLIRQFFPKNQYKCYSSPVNFLYIANESKSDPWVVVLSGKVGDQELDGHCRMKFRNCPSSLLGESTSEMNSCLIPYSQTDHYITKKEVHHVGEKSAR